MAAKEERPTEGPVIVRKGGWDVTLAQWIHLVGAGLAGGSMLFIIFALLPSVRALDPDQAGTLMGTLFPRARLIFWTAILFLSLGGLYLTLVGSGIGSLDQLFGTRYGRILTVKIGLALDGETPDEEWARILRREIVLFPETREFVDRHVQLSQSFLSALGALGPGHEWAIPVMFLPLIEGLKRYQQRHRVSLDTTYFTVHLEADEKHGELLRQALALNARSKADQEAIRAGAQRSLALRASSGKPCTNVR